MKKKLDIITFVLFILLISPYLFITGGIVRIKRFYHYTIAKAEIKTPKRYYW